jgi:hypothetical protein
LTRSLPFRYSIKEAFRSGDLVHCPAAHLPQTSSRSSLLLKPTFEVSADLCLEQYLKLAIANLSRIAVLRRAENLERSTLGSFPTIRAKLINLEGILTKTSFPTIRAIVAQTLINQKKKPSLLKAQQPRVDSSSVVDCP